jgi:hypothetical protein
MMVRFPFIILILILFISGPVSGEPIEMHGENQFKGAMGSIRVRVSDSRISIAQSLHLTIEVLIPKGYSAKLPGFAEYGFSTDFNERSQRFRATDISPVETMVQDDGATLLRQKFTLEPWLSGDYSILPLMVSYHKDENGDSGQKGEALPEDLDTVGPNWHIPAFHVMSDGIRIQVNGLGEERQEFSDILGQADYALDRLIKKERRREDKSDQELLREEEEKREAARSLGHRQVPWWILWAVLTTGLIAPLIWHFGRRRIVEFFAKPSLPAHEIAYEALRGLKSSGLVEKNMIKEFYYALSFILREYIGNRFHIFAVNQTTEEFFKSLLAENPFNRKSEEMLRLFSEHADTVKYSLHHPDAPRAMESYGIVKFFVDTTKAEEKKETRGDLR